MEFFLTLAFLINDVERRFHYQRDSFASGGCGDFL